MRRKQFTFTVSDAAILFGKSPVTLRQWEKKGIVDFPRLTNGARRMSSNDIRQIALVVQHKNYITRQRLQLINAILTMMELAEQ
jgi:DNA-binding transcriptional MerR regulator